MTPTPLQVPWPFTFPKTGCKNRRHGPSGYANYALYRDWLRDEFDFRCIYCLRRERWGWDHRFDFSVEHLVPKGINHAWESHYPNLVLACMVCNNSRHTNALPFDIETDSVGQHLRLKGNGEYDAITREGGALRDMLGLNAENLVDCRRKILYAYTRVIGRSAGANGTDFDLFRYPTELPDLSRPKPPDGNSRLQGIRESAYARRVAGTLPEFYG